MPFLPVFVLSWPKAPRILTILVAAWTIGLAAQQPPGAKTGNPTPGTPQPEPPNLANRITLTGCVRPAGVENGQRPAAVIDANSPSDSRVMLEKAERLIIVPPDTGTSAATAGAASRTYRLHAIDSQLSPFVGTRVEISGEIMAAREPGPVKTPTLQVEFVRRLASSCS
jgi:hypothetical protein